MAIDPAQFAALSPTTLADVSDRSRVMDIGIRPLWAPGCRAVGPAYPVLCPPGDQLSLHAAIHRAPPGSVIVVAAGDVDFAVAGGNVCAISQRRGIAGFVIDGAIRDLAEIREMGFPVFARGVIPIPGTKAVCTPPDQPVTCGGVLVGPGDVVVADEEGVVVTPLDQAETVLARARAKAEQDAAQTLDEWQAAHRERIGAQLRESGQEL